MLTKLFLLILPLCGALGLSACATTPVTSSQVFIPGSLRPMCSRPPMPEGEMTVAKLMRFSYEQEQALTECDRQRAATIRMVDAYNSARD